MALLSIFCAGVSAQDRLPSPPPGPAAQPAKTIVFLASDFKNGGVMGVYRGFEEAVHKLGWKVRLANGQGQKAAQAAGLDEALVNRADAIVFGGFDPDEFVAQVAVARKSGTVLVGWHAAKDPGPTRELFVNVSTSPTDVATIAADFVIWDAKAHQRPVGVVIFNDDQYAVANAKTAAMVKIIQACQGYKACSVLSVENVLISQAASAMAWVVPKLVAAHGAAWTYSLAINDVYFDEINYPLLQARRTDIRNISAGDGSTKALGRIGAGVSQQLATVAEPLRLQGYQLADELNRAFAGAPPSGFQSRPILVTTSLIKAAGSTGIESGSASEAAYSAIWSGKK